MPKISTFYAYALRLMCLASLCHLVQSSWLSKDAAREIVAEYKKSESERGDKPGRGHDRRVATPFVSGDAFRELCFPHICEDANRCKFDTAAVKDGECIFIKSDLFEMFMTHVAHTIPSSYVTVSHNGDLSTPDGQTDANRIGMPRYEAMPRVLEEHQKGRLLAHYGQNLWWRNITSEHKAERERPPFLHCLPIGIENRQYKIGGNPGAYPAALQQHIIDAPDASQTVEQLSQRPLLLIAFWPKSRVPDREKVLKYLGVLSDPKPANPFYNYTDCDHDQWLEGIALHKFVLAPFGHGLDTHRVYEILLMGGIPVMRKSSITSCFDDSDNYMGKDQEPSSRGSLPLVLLDSWNDLTKERLDSEWERLKSIPQSSWDHTRLLMKHWATRVQNVKHKYGSADYESSFGK